MINSLILMGRLSKDPETRKAGELTIANFDLAVDNVRKEKDGERGTSFFSVVCFDKLAENIAKGSVRKGSKVCVAGSIQQRNFVRKDGTKGSAYEVIANSVEFCDPRPSDDLKNVEAKGESVAKYDPFTGEPLTKEAKE